MRLLYTKPKLRDLSQGSRIAFIRQFKSLSQHIVADKLGLQHDNKRRTITRYEKGDRNPKDNRTKEIANILGVNYNAIKKYDYKDPVDLFYTLLWLEELIPNYVLDLSSVPLLSMKNIQGIDLFLKEWDFMKKKRNKKIISYEEYINWKFNYSIKEGDD